MPRRVPSLQRLRALPALLDLSSDLQIARPQVTVEIDRAVEAHYARYGATPPRPAEAAAALWRAAQLSPADPQAAFNAALAFAGARRLNDAELALREASRRFERRVTAAAELARAEGVDWSAVGLDEQERYYQRVKRAEGEGRP